MRRILAVFALAALCIFSVPVTQTYAATIQGTTTITGTVSDDSGSPLTGAKVTVTCDATPQVSLVDFTDSDGGYLVNFTAASCPNGTIVNAIAQKDDLSGTNSGTVKRLSSRLNVETVDITAVPEFGVIGAGLASLSGIGAFAVARRRQFSKN